MPPKRNEQQKTIETATDDDKYNQMCLEKQLREKEIDEKIKMASKKNSEISRRHKEVAEDKKQAEARQQAVNFNINVSQIRYREEDDDRIKGLASGRSRGRGRGRGQSSDRGRGRGEGFRTHDRFKKVNSEDEKWRLDREEIDRERMNRQKTGKGSWKREWDNDKQINDPQPPAPRHTASHRPGSWKREWDNDKQLNDPQQPAPRQTASHRPGSWKREWDNDKQVNDPQPPTPKQTVPHRPDSHIPDNVEFESRNKGRGSYNNRPKSTHFETFENFKITTDGGGRQVAKTEEANEFKPGPTSRKDDFDRGRGTGANRRQQRGRVRRGSPKNRPESGEARANTGQWRGSRRGRGRAEGRVRQRRRPFPKVEDINDPEKIPDDEYHEDNYIDAPEQYYESGPEDEKKNRAVTDSTDSLHRFIEENTLKVNQDGELVDSKSQSTDTSPKSMTLTTPTLVMDWGAEMEKQEVRKLAMDSREEVTDAIEDKIRDDIAEREANNITDGKTDELADKEPNVPNATANEEVKAASDKADVTKDSLTEAASTNLAAEKTEIMTDEKADVKETISEENACPTEDNKTSTPSDTTIEKTTDKISDSSPESKANNTSEESREEEKSPIDNKECKDTAGNAESQDILKDEKDEKANENQETEGSEKKPEDIGNS